MDEKNREDIVDLIIAKRIKWLGHVWRAGPMAMIEREVTTAEIDTRGRRRPTKDGCLQLEEESEQQREKAEDRPKLKKLRTLRIWSMVNGNSQKNTKRMLMSFV